MALLSPGVQTTEIDLSIVTSNAGSTYGAFAGNFTKGYAGKAVLVGNVAQLIENFGKPTNNNFNEWFQAYYYLQYSNNLYVSRAVDENGNWKATENTIKEATNIGKVQINGNPSLIYTGSIIKVGADSDVEYTIKNIEDPQTGQVAKGVISVNLAQIGQYDININGQPFSYTEVDQHATPESIAQGISNIINIPGVLTDTAVNGTIELEMVNPGVALNVQIVNGQLMSYQQTQEPLPVESYEIVIDDNTDFSTIFNAGQEIFVKDFSKNAFKFVPDENGTLPLDATKQIPFEDLYSNEDIYDIKSDSIEFPENMSLKVIARTFGEYGNKIQVAILRENDFKNTNTEAFTGIKVGNLFEYKPLESNQEIALLVMEDGVIVERYIVSLNPEAKDYQNRSLFVDDVIRRKSSKIYVKSNGVMPKSFFGTNAITLSNGSDGSIGKSEIDNAYGSVSEGTIFGDVENLPVDYVISNEISRTSAGKLASLRQDCIAIHGAKFDIVGQKITKATELMLEDVNTGEMNSGDTRNSYNAYFGNYAMIWDSYNDKYRWINIAGMCAGKRAKTTYEQYPWYAAAGETQGQLIGIVKLAVTPATANRDAMYVSQINPVTSFPGRGIQIYGQKTLQSKNSAFSRINVRLLFNYIKRNLSETMRSYVFELNDEFTRNRITGNCNNFLQRIQTLRGLYGYLVKCDGDNNTPQVIDNNELVVEVALKPTRVAEFIYLRLYAVGTDVSMEEILG